MSVAELLGKMILKGKKEIMPLGPLNEELIAKVFEHIRHFPESFNQNEVIYPTDQVSCGTICCFGGWGYLLSFPEVERAKIIKYNDNPMKTLEAAADKFGFTDAEAAYVFEGTDVINGEQIEVLERRLNFVRQRRALLIDELPDVGVKLF